MEQRKTHCYSSLTALALLGLFFFASPAKAGQMSPELAYGYEVYLRLHPPQDKPVKHNFYPFPGPIIQDGQDISICSAAKSAAAYVNKREIRYLTHGKDGWLFRTVDFKTDFTASPQTLEYFNRLNKLLADRGQTLVVAFQPTRGMLSGKYIDTAEQPKGYTLEKARKGYKDFLKQLNNAGILTADLLDVAPNVTYFSKGDFHWSPEGASDSAQKISTVLQDLPAYKNLEKQAFESEIIGLAPASRGAFEEFIQQTCKVNIQLTAKPVWATIAKTSGAPDAASLLGEVSFPGVTVVGTSNSAEDGKFNFVGALKHFLHADVYNAALTGGGFGSSSYRYYASDEYHSHPPKIIVWEILPQHNYNSIESINAFRQMIPATYGSCGKDKAVAEYSGDITQGQTKFFTQIEEKPLRDTYLYLEVTNPKERNLKLEILYKNGDTDQVELTRSTRMENSGKYYLELSNDTDKSALLFHVITDTPQGQLTARICQYPIHIAEK